MRLVLDTNVVVSGFLWEGAPHEILQKAVEGQVSLYTSTALLSELEIVITRTKFRRRLFRGEMGPLEIMQRYSAICEIVDPITIHERVCSDPRDQAVLECAVSADADAIGSGDHHLRELGSFRGIPIIGAGDLLAIVTKRSER